MELKPIFPHGTGVDSDSQQSLHHLEHLVQGFDFEDFPGNGVIVHSLDELVVLQLLVTVGVSAMEHLSHHFGGGGLGSIVLSTLDEVGHKFAELVQADEPAVVGIEELEHLGEVIGGFTVGEHVQKNQQLTDSNCIIFIYESCDEKIQFFQGPGGKCKIEDFSEPVSLDSST